MKKKTAFSLAVLACAGSLMDAARADTSRWVGGVGTWNTAGNWSPAGVPNSTSVLVRIDGDAGVSSQVTVDLSPSVGGLTVDAGDAVTVSASRTLTVYGSAGGLTNNGTITLAGAGAAGGRIVFNDGQTVAGAGEIATSDNSYNSISLAGTNRVLTQLAGHTIRGSGRLLDSTGGLINYGSVRAVGSFALTVDPDNFCVNAGLFRAEGGGGLTLASGAFTNAGAVIEAAAGSKVTLQSGAIVCGGTIASTGSGRITPADGSRLHEVTLAAGTVVTQAIGVSTAVSGGLVNDGVWNMSSAGSTLTVITFSGDQTLGGAGELVLSDNTYNRLVLGAVTQTLTHAAGHTIRGAGQFLNNTGNFVNRGAILAQGATALTVDPSPSFVNAGVLRAEGKGGLALAAGAYTNAGAVIEASGGSKVALLSGATVYGGTLASVDTGRIAPADGSLLHEVTLAAGTVVTQANGVAAAVSGGLVNDGVWNMSSAGSTLTALTFSGDQTLGGAGEFVLSDNTYNRLVLGAVTQTLTHAAGHTIRGAGQFLNNTGNLVNEGAILAEGAIALTLDPTAFVINASTLRGAGAGGLTLAAGAYTNAGAVIDAAAGSKVTLQSDAVVCGGTLASTGTGRITPLSGSRLHEVTLAAGTVVTQANGVAAAVSGGLVNNGVWNMGAAGASLTALSFSGDQTLGGVGELVLSDNVNNRLALGAVTQTLTHAAGHTIRGAGQILNNTGNMNNFGRMLATGSNKLTVNPSESFRNYSGGLLGGTGTFDFTDDLVDNAGTIAPGLSVGSLTMVGDVSNTSSAVFDIELGGTSAGQSDKLIVQGTLALDGELRLSLASGYLPDPEDAVTFIAATGLSGAFANAVPAAGNTASNVVTDFGTCDVTYNYAASPRTVTVSNMVPDPTLLRAVGVEAATEARVIWFAPSAADWQYTLEYRPSLLEGAWTNVPGQGPRPGIGRRDAMVHTNAPARGFYRVLGAPAP